MEDRYKLITSPSCNKSSIVQGKNYRFTILTPQLIRLEYSKNNHFEDHATQIIINRDFPAAQYRLIDKVDSLEIITDCIHLIYNKKEFSLNGLSVQVIGNFSVYNSIWHFSEEFDDLKGTARTLDNASGPIPLEHGLMSKNGFSVLDDSKSLILLNDGWIAPRETEETDIYFFGYGRGYLQCLKDFYHLCGKTPMLPRYALGNWWSRYCKYSEKSYKELILRFQQEKVPFSVAVLDMDWHLVDVAPEYGSGWTGYSWNEKLFPDPTGFMDWLHQKGMKVTLNLHPANGVMPYEDAYEDMAKELGVDYHNKEKISFDITNQRFLDAYFKYLHHPNEDAGVDFWWIDWQQGSSSKVEGLDPLWMLNHYHYCDQKRKGKRPLILSRYAGAGSHRYPIGFSGDSIISWASLDFQPYFTANASNIGYGWWSHDIGGHMNGVKDDELATRWIQFGVFSPINRLHSSASPFNGKEPWRYNCVSESIMKNFLRLRHQLIPYLYTMNYRFSYDDLPLIQPMYYQNPGIEAAYHVPNQYYFGSELIVCPITSPMDTKLRVAKVKAWLPKGIWFDFFTGMVYQGDRMMMLYRGLSGIPVLAKAGAIVPMTDLKNNINSVENPTDMDILVFAGANNQFILYEDDDESLEKGLTPSAFTNYSITWGKTSTFIISAVQGDQTIIPTKRNYTIRLRGFVDSDSIQVTANGENFPFSKTYDSQTHTICLSISSCATNADLIIAIETDEKIERNDVRALIFDFLDQAQIEYCLKEEVYRIICSETDITKIFSLLQTLELSKNLFGILCEILSA